MEWYDGNYDDNVREKLMIPINFFQEIINPTKSSTSNNKF